MASHAVRSRPIEKPSARQRRTTRGDTVSAMLTFALVLSIFCVGLVIILILFDWGAAAGIAVLTMALVLLALGVLFVATSEGGRR
jgi:hypothetical protein